MAERSPVSCPHQMRGPMTRGQGEQLKAARLPGPSELIRRDFNGRHVPCVMVGRSGILSDVCVCICVCVGGWVALDMAGEKSLVLHVTGSYFARRC